MKKDIRSNKQYFMWFGFIYKRWNNKTKYVKKLQPTEICDWSNKLYIEQDRAQILMAGTFPNK